MTTATLAPVAPTTTDAVPTADTLAAALAAVSVAGDTDKAARATLAALTLARYSMHAARYARQVGSVSVLPDGMQRDVAALIWLDATGRPSAVPVKDRTAGETSLGQYISRYGKVATDATYGLAALADVDTARDTYTQITAQQALAKQGQDAATLALAEIADAEALHAWLGAQSPALRSAFSAVARSLKGDGAPHLAAFVALVGKGE